MEKTYERIKWENYPSVLTPLNETNLNKMDSALYEVDNRVLGLDTAKLDKATANTMVKGVSFDEKTGIFTITQLDGTTKTIDTKLEKMAVNFSFDYESQKLILTLVDGTKQEVDLSSLISQYEFTDGDSISLTVDSDGKVSAIVKDGSITEEKLQPNFLADVKTEVAKAKSSSDSAYNNASLASTSAQEAKEYAEQAKAYRDEAEQFSPDGYTELQETVASNTAKIDTIIEKAELNIKNTASGENIHLTDSANGKNVAFGLYGKTEQKQYSGKNLWIHGNVSGTSSVIKTVSIDSGTYTISALITSSDTERDTSLLMYTYEDGSNGYIRLSRNTRKSQTVTFTNKVVQIRLYAGYDGDTSANDTFTWSNIQIESGSTMTEYEPYVGGIPSPNPEYPQEITVSGSDGSVEVVSCGKNLWKNTVTSQTLNDISVAVNNEDKSINFNGVATKNGALLWGTNATDYNIFLRKGNYILSAKSTSTMPSGTLNLRDSNETVIVSINLMSQQEKEFTVQTDVYCRAFLNMNSGNVYNNVTIYPMIRLASETDSTYEPYTETTSTIPTPDGLAGIKVSSGGNYTDENGQQWICDEIVKYADGSGKRIERIKHYSLAVADMNNQDDYPGWNVISDLSEAIGSVIGRINTPLMLNVGTVCNANTTSNNVIYLPTGTYGMTQTEWKEKYPDMVVEIYLAIIEPIITDLSAEEIAEIEKLYTFYPITNISNDADCGMAVTYLADSKNYIDGQLAIQKAQQEAALLNMLLLLPEETQAAMIENDTNNLLMESGV